MRRLAWTDRALGAISMPARDLEMREGFGSGLANRRGEAEDRFWAVCDRGPNLKVRVATEIYGAAGLDHLAHVDGAKLMPRLDLGPAIAELRLAGESVELVRVVRLVDGSGRPLPGVPPPEGPHAECEPVFTLEGEPIDPDPAGADTEGIAALRDGGFWLGEEYGPSLLKVDPAGRVVLRLVPAGMGGCRGANYDVAATLPALAARRKLNRGFEAIALSPDERLLHLMFQSPLAHPDRAAHERARHVRLWSLDAASG